MRAVLEKLGLTKNEATIYLALIELGPSVAGVISRKSGIHRRSVYDAIDRLIEKGLIGYIVQNNRKYFEAVNPQRLIELLKEKETDINNILPSLLQKYKFVKEKKETLFFRGKRGVKSIFDDQLIIGKEILIFGASSSATEILKYYFGHFDRERKKKNIPVKIIFDEGAREKIHKIPLANIKFVPEEYSTPTATNVYGNTVSIIIWSQNPYAILIRDKEVADSYRKYFNLMWSIAKN
ncbi:TrmB family transcriptional regulator [Candidatus Woesearchaeota archaeon]|nr:TrmB family transcriptional regulator [Candidatus Woesearchaeota archaeon]